MIRVPYRWCLTNEFFEAEVEGSASKPYLVRFSRGFWTCNCPHHKFRNVDCKHIKQVKMQKCGYGWEAATGTQAEFPDPQTVCPKCGGATTIVEIGL